jgi:hypothetical protein
MASASVTSLLYIKMFPNPSPAYELYVDVKFIPTFAPNLTVAEEVRSVALP